MRFVLAGLLLLAVVPGASAIEPNRHHQTIGNAVVDAFHAAPADGILAEAECAAAVDAALARARGGR